MSTMVAPHHGDVDELTEPKTWWLDVAPLVDFVARRGGIDRVLTPDSPFYVRFRQTWTRATRRGAITEQAADDFCVRVLHVTPASVWGDEIWRPA